MKNIKILLLCALAFPLLACQTEKKPEIALIPSENFQKEIDGKQVNLYTLKNDNGMTVQVTNFGTRVVSLWVPDKDGEFRDVVLGRNTIGEYLSSDEKFYGATVGRFANRIAKGQFTIDGETYQLDINDGENHLHGGVKGYYDVVWDAETYTTEGGEEAVLFTYLSPDGEMGYPGNLSVAVRMELGQNNTLRISYEAGTDAPTVVNLSHHSYFNLSGEGNETILDHMMKINASNFTPTDTGLIPTGEITTVVDTPLDFLDYNRIGDRIGEDYEPLVLGGGYDHNWVINASKTVNIAAEVYSPASGIRMTVHTNEPGIQFYSGNFMTGKDVGKSGKPYGYRSAFCLETQKFPDAPNHPEFPTATLRPDEKYYTVCYYSFDTVDQK